VFGVGPDAQADMVFTSTRNTHSAPRTSSPPLQVSECRAELWTLLRATSLVIDQIIAATERQLGISAGSLDSSNPPYDFVMFCMPDGTMFGENGRATWAAFAYTGDRTAFFQKGYCGAMTSNVHELGHLMDFGHSNENGIREDKSGALGRSVGQIGGPNYCLNGHKFALSGWMDERKKVVSTSSTDRGGTWVGWLPLSTWKLMNS
jgi:hypothetical protein